MSFDLDKLFEANMIFKSDHINEIIVNRGRGILNSEGRELVLNPMSSFETNLVHVWKFATKAMNLNSYMKFDIVLK